MLQYDESGQTKLALAAVCTADGETGGRGNSHGMVKDAAS
jgi:hypothetical protein